MNRRRIYRVRNTVTGEYWTGYKWTSDKTKAANDTVKLHFQKRMFLSLCVVHGIYKDWEIEAENPHAQD